MDKIPVIYITEKSQIILCSEFCRNLNEPVLVVYGKYKQIMIPYRTAKDNEETEKEVEEMLKVIDLTETFPIDFYLKVDEDGDEEDDNNE